MRSKLKLLFIGCLFIATQLSAQSASSSVEKVTYALSTLDAKGVTADEADVLSSRLRSELVNLGFTLLERGKMDEILKEQGFQKTGLCSETTCLVEMGQLLGVSYMVAGSIGRVGSSYSISVRLFSVKTGEIVKDISQTFKGSIDDLLETEIPVVARKLAGIKTDQKNRKWVYATIGVVGLGGAGLAYYFLSRPDEQTASPKQNADVKVRW